MINQLFCFPIIFIGPRDTNRIRLKNISCRNQWYAPLKIFIAGIRMPVKIE